MRLFIVALLAATALPRGVTSQSASNNTIGDLIGSFAPFLSQSCQSTLNSAVAEGTPLSTCLNLPLLGPILQINNESIAPRLDSYLKSTCSSEMCSSQVIDNTTASVWAGCSTDLTNFGITENTLRTIMNAYPTARWISCISDNDTLCAVKLLQEQEKYLGQPISIQYILEQVVSANGTITEVAVQYVGNANVSKSLLCTDCGQAAVDIVLYDYPNLENKTFDLGPNMSAATIPGLYKNLCNVHVSPNATWPKSIKSTNIEDAWPSDKGGSSSAAPSSTGGGGGGIIGGGGGVSSTMGGSSSMQSPSPTSPTDTTTVTDASTGFASSTASESASATDTTTVTDSQSSTDVQSSTTSSESASATDTTTVTDSQSSTVVPSSTSSESASATDTTTVTDSQSSTDVQSSTTSSESASATDTTTVTDSQSSTDVQPSLTTSESASATDTTTVTEPSSTDVQPSSTTPAPASTEVPPAASSATSLLARRWVRWN
ncbi:hypothetical protein NCC49_003643 [Naganishia albida]|nr:hypothetical protein NCC49_003643 [Naganishia albida]